MIPRRANEYCCEDISLIENYEQALNDKTQVWDCHHRLEIELGLSVDELIEQGLYWNRPASELIFLTKAEHRSLHYKGKPKSAEHKAKIGAGNKGKHRSEEARANISAGNKRRYLSAEQRAKAGAKLRKKCVWVTPDGELIIMNASNVLRWHPDWIIVETVDL